MTVAVGDVGQETGCAFCTGSLFEDLAMTADGGVEPSEPRKGAAPAEKSGASAVT